MKTQTKSANAVIRIFADGSGSRPDGKGSGFAFFREDNGEKQVVREDGLTNNQAEYKAILAALGTLPVGARAEILTDSQNTCYQLKGVYRVIDPHLVDLHKQIHSLIAKRHLKIEFTWISRRNNIAGKLI